MIDQDAFRLFQRPCRYEHRHHRGHQAGALGGPSGFGQRPAQSCGRGARVSCAEAQQRQTRMDSGTERRGSRAGHSHHSRF